MNIGRIDVFEDEKEIVGMVKKLQSEGLQEMRIPDALWHTKKHQQVLRATRKMGRKVLAKF